MKDYKDVMIDIETTSTKYNACIVSIGVIAFNVYDTKIKQKELEIFVNKESCDRLDLHTSEETMQWWSSQDENVRKKIFESQPRFDIKEALIILSDFCQSLNVRRYWCQGINFDPIVLENAYEKCGLTPPWKFFQLRDSRTVKQMLTLKDIDSIPKNNCHDSIEDCRNQINILHFAYKKFNLIN